MPSAKHLAKRISKRLPYDGSNGIAKCITYGIAKRFTKLFPKRLAKRLS